MNSGASIWCSSGFRSRRRGAMATPPPIARCCAAWRSAGIACCSWNATCPGTPRRATCRSPDFCELRTLPRPRRFAGALWRSAIAAADAVIVGSYVPDGVAVVDCVQPTAGGVRAFYDIDTPVTVRRWNAATATTWRRADAGVRSLSVLHRRPAAGHLAERFGARRPRALYCAVDAALYRPRTTPPRWDLGYLGTYAPDRQPALERLLIEPARRLPHCRFVVGGTAISRLDRTGRRMSSASSICRRRSMLRSTAASSSR